MRKILSCNYEFRIISNINDFEHTQNRINIFTPDFFSPKYPNSFKCPITRNTVAIHHFAASWYTPQQQIFRTIRKYFGYNIAHLCSKIYKTAKR